MSSSESPTRYSISQVAKLTGVPVATIKFYLRERLLPQPNLSAPGRGYYNSTHVKRLELLRILREVGDLSVADLKELSAALGKKVPTFEIVAMVVDRLNRPRGDRKRRGAGVQRAQSEVTEFLAQHGIKVRPTSAALRELAVSLSTLREVSAPDMRATVFEPYLEHATRLAETEFAAHASNVLGDPENVTRNAVIGTVTWERVFSALRRIIHEHMAAALLGNAQREVGTKTGRRSATRARKTR